jgi:hypothetical protein
MRLPPQLLSLLCCGLCVSGLVQAKDAPPKEPQQDKPKGPAGPVEFVKRSASTAADGLGHVGKSVVSGVSWTVSRVSKVLGIPDGTKKKNHAQVKLQITPATLNLEQHRKIDVLVKVVNPGKRALLLEFPTAQRVDAVLKDAQGKIVSRASEDQQFLEEPSVVSVNPGERVEYALTLSTRELKAGSRYKVEAAVVHQQNLHAEEFIEAK